MKTHHGYNSEIEEQDFLANLVLLPPGFILIKHPNPNPYLMVGREGLKEALNRSKWIAAYTGIKDGGINLNADGIQCTFKYFAPGNTPQEAVANLVWLMNTEGKKRYNVKGAKL